MLPCHVGFDILFVLIYLFYGAPAIGGFVVVVQMLLSFGSCIRIA
jgi:hypothetical protein